MTLAEHQLSTDLHVKNTSSAAGDSLEFQALLHNYIRAPADQVQVAPLQHLQYYDKTETSDQARALPKVEARAAVDVIRYTDSVYEGAPQNYEVAWPEGGLKIRSVNLKDVVIWNPQEEGRKIADMEEDGWCVYTPTFALRHLTIHRKHYICVEPGFVRGFVKLEAGKTWIGQQVISVLGPAEHAL